jgi:hypothetical protein
MPVIGAHAVLGFPFSSVIETDLLGNAVDSSASFGSFSSIDTSASIHVEKGSDTDSSSLTFNMKPFEIRTFRITTDAEGSL